jgi:hypothetical protein
MAIKNVTFSFDVPITTLLGLIATGNAAMRVDVFGDDKVKGLKTLANGHAIAGLLEAPHSSRRGVSMARAVDAKGNKTTGGKVIAGIFLASEREPVHSKTLKEALVAHGLAAASVSPQLTVFKKKGWIKAVEKALYLVTDRGLQNFRAMTQSAEAAPSEHTQPRAPVASASEKGSKKSGVK